MSHVHVHVNLVTLYHTTELRQNWLRWCLGAVRHQANTWANVDLSSVGFSDIHWSDIQLHRWILQLSITHISQRVCFSYLKFRLNTPGTNELSTQVIGRSQYRSAFLRQCHKKIITSTTKNENNVFGLQYQWRALIHQHCSCRKLKRGAHPISTGEYGNMGKDQNQAHIKALGRCIILGCTMSSFNWFTNKCWVEKQDWRKYRLEPYAITCIQKGDYTSASSPISTWWYQLSKTGSALLCNNYPRGNHGYNKTSSRKVWTHWPLEDTVLVLEWQLKNRNATLLSR